MGKKEKEDIEISQLSSARKVTICAVVVTYNRKKLLLECLEALKKQTRPLDAIFIIDNASTDCTAEILLENKYIPKLPPADLVEPWEISFSITNSLIKKINSQSQIRIYYIKMHENTGGAGGFYEGVKRGHNQGYDWLWLMDDDAEPKEDALEKLSKYFQRKNVSALASVVTNDVGISLKHRGFINFRKIFPLMQKPLTEKLFEDNKVVDIDMASFVGILVSRKAIQKINYPKKEFFIHHDDVEYCIRLRKTGKILLITDSIIIHKDSVEQKDFYKYFLGKGSPRTPYDKLWIKYYGRRNLIWLGKKYSINKFNFYCIGFWTYLHSIVGIIVYDDYKLKRIKLITNAYLDALNNVFDNKKPKKILYKEIIS